MNSGLRKLLERIKDQPSETLIQRFLVLAADDQNMVSKCDCLLELARHIVTIFPKVALEVAYTVYRDSRDHPDWQIEQFSIDAILVMIRAISDTGKDDKIDKLREAMKTIQKNIADKKALQGSPGGGIDMNAILSSQSDLVTNRKPLSIKSVPLESLGIATATHPPYQLGQVQGAAPSGRSSGAGPADALAPAQESQRKVVGSSERVEPSHQQPPHLDAGILPPFQVAFDQAEAGVQELVGRANSLESDGPSQQQSQGTLKSKAKSLESNLSSLRTPEWSQVKTPQTYQSSPPPSQQSMAITAHSDPQIEKDSLPPKPVGLQVEPFAKAKTGADTYDERWFNYLSSQIRPELSHRQVLMGELKNAGLDLSEEQIQAIESTWQAYRSGRPFDFLAQVGDVLFQNEQTDIEALFQSAHLETFFEVFYSDYIDFLLRHKRSRRAMYLVQHRILNRLTLSWAQLMWNKLRAIWKQQGLIPGVWCAEDGVKSLQEMVKVRRLPMSY